MKLFGIKIGKGKTLQPAATALQDRPVPQAYTNVISMSFDGEKNLGEMGPIKNYNIDYEALRLRSWQLYLESPICQLVFQRCLTWVIGNGLCLQSDPMFSVLDSAKIPLKKDFNAIVEDRFRLYSTSLGMADYSGTKTLQQLAWDIDLNSSIGGDVLVVQRVVNGIPKIQLIDGCHVMSPYNLQFDGEKGYLTPEGNRIKHGVEIDKTGKHIAYHVRIDFNKWERVPAYNNEHLVATLVYGLPFRLDGVRGLPLIAAVMETAAKLERYQEATLGSAEEAAKVAYSIEHDHTSTGENPLAASMAQINGFGKPGDNPQTYDEKKLLNKVAATTNKQAVNLPIGSKLVMNESRKEIHFTDFFTTNIHLVCSTVGIPPEVALMKYDSNFSASRAALKDWEHTLNVKREKFANQFYKPIYQFWLTLEVLSGKVIAPGYARALKMNDEMTLAAFRNSRFTGSNVPHIDPLKEVNAERAKLGKGSEHIPLTTVEKATAALNGGDSYANMADYAAEMQEAERLKIEKVPLPAYRTRQSVPNDEQQ